MENGSLDEEFFSVRGILYVFRGLGRFYRLSWFSCWGRVELRRGVGRRVVGFRWVVGWWF